MDGWPYAVVDNSQKPGTGNREPGTGNMGTPMPRGKGGNRERGTGNRGRGTGNRKHGDTRGRKERREQELRVRSAECRVRNDRHWSFVTGQLQRQGDSGKGDEGRGTRKLPKRQTAANGRESGFGGRKPAQTGRVFNRSGSRRFPWGLQTQGKQAFRFLRESGRNLGAAQHKGYKIGGAHRALARRSCRFLPARCAGQGNGDGHLPAEKDLPCPSCSSRESRR